MAYISTEVFHQRLSEGFYKFAAGARRAVGRSPWRSAEKAAGYAAVDAYFGAAAAPGKAAKKAAPPAAPTPPPIASRSAAARAPAVKASKTTVAPAVESMPLITGSVSDICELAHALANLASAAGSDVAAEGAAVVLDVLRSLAR